MVKDNLLRYLKGYLATAAAITNALVAWLPSGPVTGAQWAQIVVGIVGAVAVILFPNSQASDAGRAPSRM
jgi:hypothetical protein